MLEDVQAQALGEIDRGVGTVVVDEDADVDQIGEFADRDFERLLRVVSGHDDRDALAVDHSSGRADFMIPEARLGLTSHARLEPKSKPFIAENVENGRRGRGESERTSLVLVAWWLALGCWL